MAVSVFDLFKIGIGPSSSHTVGPMRAAGLFVARLAASGRGIPSRLRVELFGSLGATGRGHGSDKAVLLGLAGHDPETVEVERIEDLLTLIRSQRRIDVPGVGTVEFNEAFDLVFHRHETLPFHTNGLRFQAMFNDGQPPLQHDYYSVGGGFVVSHELAQDGQRQRRVVPDVTALPIPFRTGEALLQQCRQHGLSIAQVMQRNERHWRSDEEISQGLQRIWSTMQACVERGCHTEGILPGGFKVKRRAADWYQSLKAETRSDDPFQVMDWVNLYALAVNEENAAGGRVVTAPTNGAAGIIPAVLHYYWHFVPGADSQGIETFLLTAAAIGILYKENASISGAEVGCQGEVGVACSMAAAGLCAVLGGSPEQIENAAEIGMEHHLGLTCDPVGGLVQIPCIERNAIASVKAINAARMALRGDGTHHVSLDKVIKTMRETGADMMSKYKETARGGLAVNVVEC